MYINKNILNLFCLDWALEKYRVRGTMGNREQVPIWRKTVP
jgi:hypothetical protein